MAAAGNPVIVLRIARKVGAPLPHCSADEEDATESREVLLREDSEAMIYELYALEKSGDSREWVCPGCTVIRRVWRAEAEERARGVG